MSERTKFYFNLSTGNVEEGQQSAGTEVMGPYATRQEAERALQTAAARNEKWEEADKDWEGYDTPPAKPSERGKVGE